MAKSKKDIRTDARRELRAGSPHVWIPVDDGDQIDGFVTDVRMATSETRGQNGKDPRYPLLTVTVKAATGYPEDVERLDVHAMPTVLYNEVLGQQPRPGERVVITYIGTGEIKVRGRNAPERFRVTLPERDPKEVANNVYGALSPAVSAPVPAPAAPGPPDEDTPPY